MFISSLPLSSSAPSIPATSSETPDASEDLTTTASIHVAPSPPRKFSEEWVRLPGSWIGGDKGGAARGAEDAGIEIEELIIKKLVDLHSQWIAGQVKTVS